jgi:predicted acyl esterase
MDLHLRADGALRAAAGEGGRDYLFTPPALSRPANAPKAPLPSALTWDTAPATAARDVVGAAELQLEATSTAADVDWIAKLSLVDQAGAAHDLTWGWLRVHEPKRATVPFVPTAVRVRPGERLRLTLTSCDHQKGHGDDRFHAPSPRNPVPSAVLARG